jgi:transcriptional regulator with XRE-family HTH domain
VLSQPHDRECENALKIFGGNVRRERLARRLSQEKLAVLVHLNVRIICEIESGQLDLSGKPFNDFGRRLDVPCLGLVELNGKRER